MPETYEFGGSAAPDPALQGSAALDLPARFGWRGGGVSQGPACDCGAPLARQGGCAFCPVCGESSCQA